MSLFIYFLVASLNLWIWKLYEYDYLFLAITLGFSFYLYYYLTVRKNSLLLFTLFIFFLLPQISVASPENFSQFSTQERVIQIRRLNAYPQSYSILGKRVYLPLAHWLEQRPEAVVFYNINKKLSRLSDLNYYFFASHPKERVGIKEFEKFPYIFLPFFVLGSFLIWHKYRSKTFFILMISSLTISLFFKYTEVAGPFVLYPFFAAAIMAGLKGARDHINEKYNAYYGSTIFIFSIILFLVLVQIIAYELS